MLGACGRSAARSLDVPAGTLVLNEELHVWVDGQALVVDPDAPGATLALGARQLSRLDASLLRPTAHRLGMHGALSRRILQVDPAVSEIPGAIAHAPELYGRRGHLLKSAGNALRESELTGDRWRNQEYAQLQFRPVSVTTWRVDGEG